MFVFFFFFKKKKRKRTYLSFGFLGKPFIGCQMLGCKRSTDRPSDRKWSFLFGVFESKNIRLCCLCYYCTCSQTPTKFEPKEEPLKEVVVFLSVIHKSAAQTCIGATPLWIACLVCICIIQKKVDSLFFIYSYSFSAG